MYARSCERKLFIKALSDSRLHDIEGKWVLVTFTMIAIAPRGRGWLEQGGGKQVVVSELILVARTTWLVLEKCSQY